VGPQRDGPHIVDLFEPHLVETLFPLAQSQFGSVRNAHPFLRSPAMSLFSSLYVLCRGGMLKDFHEEGGGNELHEIVSPVSQELRAKLDVDNGQYSTDQIGVELHQGQG